MSTKNYVFVNKYINYEMIKDFSNSLREQNNLCNIYRGRQTN